MTTFGKHSESNIAFSTAGNKWAEYEKIHTTHAVKLPADVVIPTREGEVQGKKGDYLCIDADGGLYPCDAQTFEKMYKKAGL